MAALAARFNDMLGRLEESFGRRAVSPRTSPTSCGHPSIISVVRWRLLWRSRDRTQNTSMSLVPVLKNPFAFRDLLTTCSSWPGPRTPRPKSRKKRSTWCELTAIQEFYEPKAAEAGVQLIVTAEPELTAELNRPLLQRALANLIDNALRHTPSGGTVLIRASHDNSTLRLEVADTGNGIEPAHFPHHSFDRFYRVDTPVAPRPAELVWV